MRARRSRAAEAVPGTNRPGRTVANRNARNNKSSRIDAPRHRPCRLPDVVEAAVDPVALAAAVAISVDPVATIVDDGET